VLPVVALAGALWSVIPFALWWTETPASAVTGAWLTWAWGTAVVTGLAVVAVILTRGRAAEQLPVAWRRIAARVPATTWVVACGLALATLAVVSCLVLFSGNPRNVDGFAQLFQARILLAGRLWAEAPPEVPSFATLHMVFGPDRWYSQYPFGQALVLAGGLALGAWWLLNPLFCVGLVVATYRVAAWATDEATARLTTVLFVLSPFVVAVSGSELSHLPAVALGVGAAAAATMLGGGRWPLAALGAGVGLGLLTAFRPLDAVAAAIPVGLIALLAARRRVAALAVIGTAGAIATLPTLWFNAGTTGAWLEFGYHRLWGSGISLGFREVPWGVPLTARRAVALTGFDLHQLNMYLLDLPVPALLVLAAGYAVGRRRLAPRDAVPFAGVVALLGLFFFYWHRDVFYGPRLLFGAVPWLILLLARAVVLLRRAMPRPVGAATAGSVAVLWFAVAIVVGLVAIAPSRLAAYRASTPVLDLHPDRDARVEGIRHAVVVIPDGWGSRLIARMWGHGVPVRRSTRLYSAIDACTLELALDRADADSLAPERVLRTLDSLAGRNQPGLRAGVTIDPNLRLPPPGPLPAACVDELTFDRPGFLAFAPFLYLNAHDLQGAIVWARDLRDGNGPLFRRYAGRRFYRYGPAPPDGAPRFTPLEGPEDASHDR
jgi:hypothetical protein